MSLVEAMFLEMPIVAVGSTIAPMTVLAEAGAVSADVKALACALPAFVADAIAGKAARAIRVHALRPRPFPQRLGPMIAHCCR